MITYLVLVLLLLLGVFCGPAPASAKWLRAETEHFMLYSDGSEANLREMAVKRAAAQASSPDK